MISLKNQKQYCRLRVLGYEFENSDIEEDLNWLEISLEAGDKFYDWTAKGSYIRAKELKYFLDWLAIIFDEGNACSEISFLEHELSFGYDSNQKELIVKLDYNFHPKKEDYDYENDEEYVMKFHLSSSKLIELLKTIEKVIEKYPVRSKMT